MKKPIAIALCSIPLVWAGAVHATETDTLNPDLQGSPSTAKSDTPVPESRASGANPTAPQSGTQGTMDSNRAATANPQSDTQHSDSPADRNPNRADPTDRDGMAANSRSTDNPPNVPRTAR